MKKQVIMLGVLLVFISGHCISQTDDRQKAIKAIQQLSRAYLQSLLSFDISYWYADEASPSKYLDSLKGHCTIDGAQYWYSLDSTEMLCSNGYVVILYKQDKIMYLTKPSQNLQTANPLSTIDSVLQKMDNLGLNIVTRNNQTIVTINFLKTAAYKKLEYYIDNKTGLLSKLISVVRSEQLYDPAVQKQIDKSGAYAIVETMFSNYRHDTTERLFNSDRYFKKEGNEYVTVAPWQSYTIFLGNPGL